ncbi:copper-binding protein [Delftia acidovorans]|jgi:Cu/Ag efflux protein CusF|uniref:copper-binding protein n=1 Tax=Delftia acidovorans TaxID=80866 RepID=UPI002847E58E|nr:copper-binding protein [Delftia acidovorans]
MSKTDLLASRPFLRLALAAALIPAWASAQATSHDHAAHGAQAAETAPAATSQDLSEGEVTRWDARTNKVTLRHGELRNLGMPPMTMVFQLRVASPEPALKAGDKVRFRAEQDQGAFVVTQLEVLR